MNKKHLILPLVACLMLAGCTLGKKTSKKKKKSTSGSEISQKSDSEVPQSSSGKEDSSGTSTPTPVSDWSSTEKTNFQTAFHGIVPPYLSVGLNATKTDVANGYFESNEMTQAQMNAYFETFDSTWTDDVDSYGDPTKVKDSADGKGFVTCMQDYDEEGNYFVEFVWDSPVVSISLSGTYRTEFEVGETFSSDGLVVSATCKDGYVYPDVTTYCEVSSPDMSSAGTKEVTVSFEYDEETTLTAKYTITVKSTVKYTVTFNAGEGTGTKAAVEAGESYILPDATGFVAPEGKAFAGWKVGGEGETLSAGSSIELKADVTLVAQWATECTVSFSAGEGKGTMEPMKVGEGGKISEPECTFEAPEGYEFDKWVIGTEAVTFPYTVTGNVEFTATYKEKPVVTGASFDLATDSMTSTANYTSTCTITSADGQWTTQGGNNNNNGWKFIKFGHKSYDHVDFIQTEFTTSGSKVTVNFGGTDIKNTDLSMITGIRVYVSSEAFTGTTACSDPEKLIYTASTLPTGEEDLDYDMNLGKVYSGYFQIVMEIAKDPEGKNNGPVVVKGVVIS